MVDVFFRGYGAWWSTEYIGCDFPPEQVTESYEAAGVFKLTDHDSMAYKHCKELVGINKLLSSRHPDSELVRALTMPDVVDRHAFLGFDDSVDEKYYYFSILTTHTLIIAEPHTEAKQQKTDISKNLDSNYQEKCEILIYVDVPKRADLIDLVSLSKAIARRHNMTIGEACDWVTTKINPIEEIYDISGFTLPKRIPEAIVMGAANECFNQNWWNHPENEGKPIPGWNGISANGIAISKADAEKYCFIPSSELGELSAGKLPLCADDLDVAIRTNLIDLISLSKAIAKHQRYTNTEACEWVTGDIIRKQLLVYDLSGRGLPTLIESRTGMIILALCYELWAEHSDQEDIALLRFGMNVSEVAISKADAEKYFSISSSIFEELLPEKPALSMDADDVTNETVHKINDSTEAEQQPYISKFLMVLNEAASIFWLNADPAERDTHPTNDKVTEWLKLKGFSDINAKQGAVIIRPEWAAKGRR